MQPQGTGVVNANYITNLTAEINAIQGFGACAEIQTIVNAAAASIQAELAGIRKEIAALLPILTIPAANPGAIVAWITAFVAPQLKAYNTYATQLTTLLAEVGALESAIANAASRLTSCSITIPPMV
jgi:hypothetical protein